MVDLEYQSSVSIDGLIEKIGPEESEELLETALPIIIVRKRDILNALEQNDISAAAKHAHKAAGSIRLYGSSRLETLLLEVMSLNASQPRRPDLYCELESGFDAAIHEIQARLKSGFA